MPFLAICRSLLPLFTFLASYWYQKAKLGLQMSLRNKKMINYHIKRPYKTTCIKQRSTFLSFSFLIDCCIIVFSLSLLKRLQILKIGKILLANFHCIQKLRKFENADRNILPKTYSFKRYFGLFRPSET